MAIGTKKSAIHEARALLLLQTFVFLQNQIFSNKHSDQNLGL